MKPTAVAIPIHAVIDPAGPYSRHWLGMLGTDCVEVESAEPITALNADGSEGPFYRIKVASLSEYQLGRLVRTLAEHWGLDWPETLAEIRGEHGIPIEARDVFVGDPVAARIHFALRSSQRVAGSSASG